MTKWRPEGWGNPYRKDTTMTSTRDGAKHRVFEAGADAMLEGLKKEGTFGHLFDSSILNADGGIVGLTGYDEDSSKDGYFLFISEEE